MIPRGLPNTREAAVMCLFTGLTALTCAGLVSVAALVPAPPALLPVVAAVCILLPMLAASQASSSLAVLKHRLPLPRLDERALGKLRRDLDQLPETRHPLGL